MLDEPNWGILADDHRSASRVPLATLLPLAFFSSCPRQGLQHAAPSVTLLAGTALAHGPACRMAPHLDETQLQCQCQQAEHTDSDGEAGGLGSSFDSALASNLRVTSEPGVLHRQIMVVRLDTGSHTLSHNPSQDLQGSLLRAECVGPLPASS